MSDGVSVIPPDFVALELQSGFDERFGTTYGKEVDGKLILGFRIQEHHLNMVGGLHGGALATFADWQVVPARRMAGIVHHTPTISLTTDYVALAKLGGWVEMTVNLQKETPGMLFTSAEICCEGELIARSTGIYRKSKKIAASL